MPKPKKSLLKRKPLKIKDYVQGVLAKNKAILARTITLIESNAPSHIEQGQQVLRQLMPHTGNSLRLGITGAPGTGKSTLIEALGTHLISKGRRVAVLAVDPSSSRSGGSIMGDKTRMENLANNPRCFIRPSPTKGTLGGVARKTRESLLICEAAGFDVIIVETVGVGQSEISARSLVDFFILLQISGSGDELQGFKKGVMEIADAIWVNKADGNNKIHAQSAKQDIATALKYLPPATEGWHTKAFTCSALTGEGIPEIWKVVEKFRDTTQKSGAFDQRRRQQSLDWMQGLIKEQLQTLFLNNKGIKKALKDIEDKVMAGNLPAVTAAQILLEIFNGKIKD